MSVAQPTHLLIFNETSGTSVTNYGTDGTAYVIQQGTSPTNYEWVQQAQAPTGGYLDAKTKTGSNMPYLTTAASAFASTQVTINCAIGFTVDSLETIVNQRLITGTSGVDALIRINSPTAGGDFDIVARIWDTSNIGASHTFTNRSFGTFYQVAMSINYTTPSATQSLFKINAETTVTPSTVDATATSLPTTHPYINRTHDFTNYGGNDGRFYYIAYQRGGTAWSSTDLGDINSNPSSAITGWPSSIAFVSPLTWMKPNPLIGL